MLLKYDLEVIFIHIFIKEDTPQACNGFTVWTTFSDLLVSLMASPNIRNYLICPNAVSNFQWLKNIFALMIRS